ncbi:MAG: efflux RND transporter permease subunit [Candidatus Nanoarchaeia archaeon]
MNPVRKLLVKLADAQKKYKFQMLIVVLIITAFMIVGVTKMQLQTDLNKEMPNNLPVFQLNERVNEKFGGQDVVIILLRVDDSSDSGTAIRDIADPKVIEFMYNLQAELVQESSIYSVTSPASFPEGSPMREGFLSKDHMSGIMYVQIDVGSGDKKITEVTELIQSKAETLSVPQGIKVYVTGEPPMRVTIFELLKNDAVFTLILASAIILILLIVMLKSFTKGLLVFTPLMLGLIWTIGTMGWLGLKLSIVTVGLGAMILGLGVEYGIFMLSRYYEERHSGKTQQEALRHAVPGVGFSVFGSGVTTIVGFLALTLSVMPMLRHLGVSLALGITYSLIAALVVAPVIILYEEDYEYYKAERAHRDISEKRKMHEELRR